MLMRLAVVLGLAASLAPALGPDEIWVNRLDLGQDEMAWGIDSRGNDIVATGYFTDTSLTAGCLVVKLDQSGDTIWTRTFATGLDDYGTAVCIDAEGSVYVAGHTSQVLRAGPGPALIDATRARAGSAPALRQDQNALVLKYDADDDLKWSHVLPARGAVGVAVDDSGGCYVTGYAGDILVSSDLWWA
ncbi:hypothetical protein FJY71_10075, partial [candidate division WOR-3 bacterium]|nr:hypothetical protein [candidate division WOR-3 bacterium]